MPRSDPTRSRYCATRHLLRNLRQPRSLRRNPLAREAFAGGDLSGAMRTVASRVDAALHAMDRDARQASILVRVDVQRHDPRAVAADLGLSIRQFHRERRAAHERFYSAYATKPTLPSISLDDGFAQRLLERASRLGDAGEISSATAILHDVACSGADDVLRCDALVRRAEIDAWAHRLPRARAHLNAADAILAKRSAEELRDLHDASQAVSLLVRWFTEGPLAAAHAREAANGRATLVRAAAALRGGEAEHAARLLHKLDTTALSPEFAVDAFILQGELIDFSPETPMLSEQLFARAAELARANGFVGRELYATHQLALTRWAHTRNPRERAAYRALVDRVDRSLPPRLRSYLIFSAADVELAIGHPQRALRAAEIATRVSTNRYELFSARGLAAGALLRLGRTDAAADQAALAADAARSEGHARVLALAQRISAQAHLFAGNRRAARTAIEESIECARRFSSPHALAQSQAVLGRIGGG